MNLNQQIMRPVGPSTSKNGIFISKFFYQYTLSVNAPGPSMNLNQQIMRPVGPSTSKNGILNTINATKRPAPPSNSSNASTNYSINVSFLIIFVL
jgi:hypothetical protein